MHALALARLVILRNGSPREGFLKGLERASIHPGASTLRKGGFSLRVPAPCSTHAHEPSVDHDFSTGLLRGHTGRYIAKLRMVEQCYSLPARGLSAAVL